MAWTPGAPIGFNVSCENLLAYALPPFRAGDERVVSTTRSRYRLHWNQLVLWPNFDNAIVTYWNTVSQHDKTALVTTQQTLSDRWQSVANDTRIMGEDNIKACMDTYPLACHSAAANGANGAPMPGDLHSSMHRCGSGAAQWGLAGVPNFVMYHANRVTALVEVKNPWLVTPQKIDEVLNSNVHVLFTLI
jgi:hypothetical protein